jgi:predicted DNA-binding transcriptional regulator YafY
VVHPLGLAAKGLVWYLVADTDAGLRTFRVDRMTAVELSGEPVVRPDGFNLAEAWKLITDEVERRRTPVHAEAVAAPEIVPVLRWVLGTRVQIGPAEPDGRIALEIRGQSIEALAGEIAGFGALIEVVAPIEVRDQLARLGRELAALYP